MKDVVEIGQYGCVRIWRSMYAPFQVFEMSVEEAQLVFDRLPWRLPHARFQPLAG
jgi:hypothetical protein